LFSLLKSSGDMPVATQARFSSDGRFVAVALRKTGSASTPAEENVRVWDVASGKGLAQTGSAPLVRQMEFSPANRFLISGGADGMARIWEVSSGGLVAELRHGPALTHAVNQVAFSPEGRQEILVAGADNTARVWAGITDNKGWIWTGFKAATPVLRHSDRVT